ncbi:helix-turn-helix and ligand-binding sensor domain-containing protein [Dyadobacter chenhuakuii]|uniref:LuxR family transcriptional regulator n=1 Tax=Dyadobacter chenhuakuii TaxID=2909339 RepID=A0ABY4XFG2_9BACT|nr:triple tyrosine motif-containing protein [Dyadobacter chenhuakuii]MCF2496581.1 LuxR family transcriptional regulator [Dyadobacter chenhuakuii]USJ29159.1 LuxR family transcriptional regulator [Dyadobacter chenhuakuii]
MTHYPFLYLTKNHKAALWTALLLFFAIIFAAKAQETPPLINYSSAIYKAHNQNWAIDQTSDQIIYAANSDGLMEYDGAAWKLYPLPDRQIVRTVLCDETVPNMLMGKVFKQNSPKEQRIYVGGFSEFGYWKKEFDGQLKYHSLSKSANFASLKTEEIWHITKTPTHIYFQSFSRIYRYDGQNITELSTPGNFMFLRFVQNRLFLPTIGKGIYELRGKKFEKLAGTEPLSAVIVSAILPFSNGQILITTFKHGLFLWKDGLLSPWKIPLSEELKTNIINRAVMLRQDSSLVFGTIQSGVYVIEKNGKLKYHFNKDTGLQNNTVLALTEDRRNQLWIGLDQGIDMLKMSSPVISYQTNDNPLGSTYAAAIWRGKLYVGSNKGVFVKKWLSNEPFQPVPGLEGQTWNLQVFDDQLLCGHNDATYRINEQGITKLSNITGGWVMLPIQSGQESLLLQGSYNGLHVYKKNSSQQWAYAYPIKGISPIPVRQIVRDEKGAFWLGHAYRGLFMAKLTPALDSAYQWKEFKAPADLPGEFAVEIMKWRKRLYVRSGSVFLQPDANDKLQVSTDFAQHSEDEAFKIRTGVNGDWFKVFINRITYYASDNQVHNLPLALIRNSETIIPVSKDYYFFCLDNGYALYNRTSGAKNVEPPASPIVRKVANLRNLSQSFSILGKPALPSNVRSLRINFALPVYGQSTQYKYRLRGLSDQWSEWTDQNFVEFTNLESTRYTFEVKSNLNDRVTAYQFSVQPYWRETLIAKIVFIALIGLVFVGLILYQEERLRRHRNRLMREQEEKLRQQQLANERQIMQIQNEKLQSDIQGKSQQLSNIAINVVRKNEILEEIRDELKQVKAEMGQQLPNIHYQKLLNSIERNVAGKDDWMLFEQNFDEVHEQFFKRLRQIAPTISPSELRLAACLRMNLSTKEMAPVLGISIRGVEIKRYRLRKKLGLGTDGNLVQFMMDI